MQDLAGNKRNETRKKKKNKERWNQITEWKNGIKTCSEFPILRICIIEINLFSFCKVNSAVLLGENPVRK